MGVSYDLEVVLAELFDVKDLVQSQEETVSLVVVKKPLLTISLCDGHVGCRH